MSTLANTEEESWEIHLKVYTFSYSPYKFPDGSSGKESAASGGDSGNTNWP